MENLERNLAWKIARVISDIFVPPTFVLFSFTLLAFELEKTSGMKIWVIVIGFVFGFLLPILFFLMLRKRNLVVNRDATIKEERTLPYSIGIILSMIAAATLYYSGASALAIALWLAYVGNTAILILINKFWKISAHAIGAATPVALLYYLYGASGLWLLILVLIIAWARLKLKVHTPMQVTAGTLYGIVLTYLQLLVYVRWF